MAHTQKQNHIKTYHRKITDNQRQGKMLKTSREKAYYIQRNSNKTFS